MGQKNAFDGIGRIEADVGPAGFFKKKDNVGVRLFVQETRCKQS
jgi:hypothetical protein